MTKTSSTANPPFGFEPERRTVRATPRVAVSRGNIVQFDIGQSDGNVDTFSIGRESGAFANLIAVTAQGVKSGVFGIALEDIAIDTPGNFLLSGLVEAKVIRSSGDVTAGNPLVAIAASTTLDGTAAAGEKYVALALETKTTPTVATDCWVWFDGVDGFGTFVS